MSRAKTARILAWCGLAGLVGLRAGALVGDVTPESAFIIAYGFGYLLPVVLTAIVGGVLALRLLGSLDHWFWGLITIACTSLFLADAYFGWYVLAVDAQGPPLWDWFQGLHAIGVVSFGLLIGTLTDVYRRPWPVRLRLFIDVAIAMAAAYPIVFLGWTQPIFASIESGDRIAAWAAVYPVFGVAMFTIIVWVLAGEKAGRWRPWEQLVVTAVAMFTVGLALFPLWYPTALARGVIESNWYFTVLGLGAYVMFIAGVYRSTAFDASGLGSRWGMMPAPLRQSRRLYPVLMAASLPLIVAMGSGGDLATGAFVEAAVLVLVVLLTVRSWLVERESAMDYLSVVVDARTGLGSARYMEERLREVAEEARITGSPYAVAAVKIDDFKRLDGLYGRDVGDALIGGLGAAVLRNSSRGFEGFRSRFDEFVLLFGASSASVAADVTAAAIAAFEQSHTVPGAVQASVSAGVAGSPVSTTDVGDLLTFARLARLRARESVDRRVCVFEAQDAERLGSPAAVRLAPRWSLAVVSSLAAASDARDPRAADHSARVARLSEDLASLAHLSSEDAERVRTAASFHDIGKLGVSRVVLGQTLPWNDVERADFERHPELAARMLRALGLKSYEEIVRHHHERWDGTGYPGRLKGARIPLEARILAICDSFEALVSGRVTGTPLGTEDALAEIRSGAGSRFDPELAALFADGVTSGAIPRPA